MKTKHFGFMVCAKCEHEVDSVDRVMRWCPSCGSEMDSYKFVSYTRFTRGWLFSTDYFLPDDEFSKRWLERGCYQNIILEKPHIALSTQETTLTKRQMQERDNIIENE